MTNEQTWSYINDAFGNIVQIVFFSGKTRESSLYIERNNVGDVVNMTHRPAAQIRREVRKSR